MKLISVSLLSVLVSSLVPAGANATTTVVPEGSTCTSAVIDNSIANRAWDEATIQYYEPKVILCPPVASDEGDNAVVFEIHYKTMELDDAASDGQQYTPGTYSFYAAHHDEPENPAAGILLGGIGVIHTPSKTCDTTRTRHKHWNHARANRTNVSNCPEKLRSEGMLCNSELWGVEQQSVAFAVINTGGCVGNLTVLAAIEDAAPMEVVATPSICTSEIQEFCSGAASGQTASELIFGGALVLVGLVLSL